MQGTHAVMKLIVYSTSIMLYVMAQIIIIPVRGYTYARYTVMKLIDTYV